MDISFAARGMQRCVARFIQASFGANTGGFNRDFIQK
jgi:hypothetical protein